MVRMQGTSAHPAWALTCWAQHTFTQRAAYPVARLELLLQARQSRGDALKNPLASHHCPNSLSAKNHTHTHLCVSTSTCLCRHTACLPVWWCSQMQPQESAPHVIAHTAVYATHQCHLSLSLLCCNCTGGTRHAPCSKNLGSMTTIPCRKVTVLYSIYITAPAVVHTVCRSHTLSLSSVETQQFEVCLSALLASTSRIPTGSSLKTLLFEKMYTLLLVTAAELVSAQHEQYQKERTRLTATHHTVSFKGVAKAARSNRGWARQA